MKITEVRLVPPSGGRGLVMGASITIDNCFVVHDIKVIDKGEGEFLSMPSKKAQDQCPQCRWKNVLTARYCNQCGIQLPEGRMPPPGTSKLYFDLAHPITAACREMFNNIIIGEYYKYLQGETVVDGLGNPLRREENENS